LRLLGAAAVFAVVLVPSALSASESDKGATATAVSDHFPSPQGEKQAALRQAALEQKLAGKISANTKVAKVAKGQ
jgi:hypothetical protein